jgi:hypothetical protein
MHRFFFTNKNLMGKTNYPPKSKPVSKHVIVNASELNRIREESANFSRSIGDPSQV